MSALGVAGEHDLTRQGRTDSRRGAAGRADRINHGARLAIGMQIGMVRVRGLGKSEVIRRHHGIPLGGIHGGEQEGLAVRRVGKRARLLNVRPLRIGDETSRCRAIGTGRHQHDAGGIAQLTRYANGVVVERDDFDIALRCAGQRLERSRIDRRLWQSREDHRRVDQRAAGGVVISTAPG